MIGTRYIICYWTTNRSDPQNLLSITLDVPLQGVVTQCSGGALSHLLCLGIWRLSLFYFLCCLIAL